MTPRILMAFLAAALLAGCNETAQKTDSSTTGGAPSTPATTEAAAPATGGKVHKLASGLQYEDLVVGNGTMAEPGMNVSVHYTGWLTDGTKFDSSVDGGDAEIVVITHEVAEASFRRALAAIEALGDVTAVAACLRTL